MADGCFLHSPSSSIITIRGGRILWISVLGALIPIWRQEITDSCDISCLLIWQELFSFHRGHGNPLQYTCLENPINRRAWWAIVYRVQNVEHSWSNWACKNDFKIKYWSFDSDLPFLIFLMDPQLSSQKLSWVSLNKKDTANPSSPWPSYGQSREIFAKETWKKLKKETELS